MSTYVHGLEFRSRCHYRELLLVLLIACIDCRLAYGSNRPHRKSSGVPTARNQSDDVDSTTHRWLRQASRRLPDLAQPGLAATYMDSLLGNLEAARHRLVGNFERQSKFAVVYMCFERIEMIHRAVPAIVSSDGLAEFDFFISQDGGASSMFENKTSVIPNGVPYVHIRHSANLCAGLHHYFVKAFAFDIMGYEILIVVEEDNVIHPQALQLLRRMAELSAEEPEVGVVSLLDMDMSPFLDAERYSAGLIRTVGPMGHLWVFGLHRSKYEPARGCLQDYYEVIKGHDYRMKHEAPLRDAIVALIQEKGFEDTSVLSQDRFFINSLAKFGFTKRYQTLFRFFVPIGYYGLHFRWNESHFFSLFGRGMYKGRIDPTAAFDATKNPEDGEAIKATVRARLTELYNKYWGGIPPPERLVSSTYNGLIEGRLNGVEALYDITRDAKVKMQ